MLWSMDIAVSIKGNEVLFEGIGSNKILYIGSSAAILGGYAWVNSFVVTTLEKRSEVVAVKVSRKTKGKIDQEAYLIGITWRDGNPFIDPQKNWFLFEGVDRVGVIDPNGCISVNVDGTEFTTDPDKVDKLFISSVDIVCEYLAGHVDGDLMWQNSKETEAEISIHERYENLEKNIAGFLSEIDLLDENNSILKESCKELEQQKTHWQKEAEGLKGELELFKKVAEDVIEASESNRFPRVILDCRSIIRIETWAERVVEAISHFSVDLRLKSNA